MRSFRRFLLIVLAVMVLVWIFAPSPGVHVEQGSILVVQLSGDYAEGAEPSLVGRLLGDRRRSFVSLMSNLAKAQRDDRLSGVALRIRRLSLNWAMAQELRGALRDLREAGRPTLAYLETGGLGANREYYIASAADQVAVAPGTSSPIVGLAMQFLFLGGMWEKIGAGVEAIGSGEYKSAAEMLSGKEMSDAHREMATALLDSTFEQFVGGIAESRGLSEEFVRKTIDQPPIATSDLEGIGLVDGVGSFEQMVRRLGGGALIKGEDYAGVDPATVGFEPVANFALVYGSGTVVMGRGNTSSTGGMVLTSDTVSQALEEAAEDPTIRAIIFRVDSPGGSPLAADIVWGAAERAKREGKPLVASISNMAASGGYYVLAGADAVVASPGSLVGSIGAFVVRPVIGGLLEKLGIGVESMQRGTYANLTDFSQPLDPGGRARLTEEIDAIYDLFVERVAAGRGLTPGEVDRVGRGRVFTGAQALENGLVDELGGLRTAVLRAKQEVGLDADADVALVPFPAPRSLAEQVAEALRQVSVAAAPNLELPGALESLQALASSLPLGTPLLVPPYVVDIR